MLESELAKRLAFECEISESLALILIKKLRRIIQEEVAAGGRVRLTALGEFRTRRLPPRNWKHPQTGEVHEIPASAVPHFSVSDTWRNELKENLNPGG